MAGRRAVPPPDLTDLVDLVRLSDHLDRDGLLVGVLRLGRLRGLVRLLQLGQVHHRVHHLAAAAGAGRGRGRGRGRGATAVRPATDTRDPGRPHTAADDGLA